MYGTEIVDKENKTHFIPNALFHGVDGLWRDCNFNDRKCVYYRYYVV
jgi:hypothetical protein